MKKINSDFTKLFLLIIDESDTHIINQMIQLENNN